MTAIVISLVFAAGYVASVYSWTHVRTWFAGVETEIRSLEDRIKALKGKF